MRQSFQLCASTNPHSKPHQGCTQTAEADLNGETKDSMQGIQRQSSGMSSRHQPATLAKNKVFCCEASLLLAVCPSRQEKPQQMALRREVLN